MKKGIEHVHVLSEVYPEAKRLATMLIREQTQNLMNELVRKHRNDLEMLTRLREDTRQLEDTILNNMRMEAERI